jgi:hypothetical protein
MRVYLMLTLLVLSIIGSDLSVLVIPDNTPEPTPQQQEEALFPTAPLMCPEDLPVNDGPAWRTIEIGKSTLDDIENIYGVRFTLDSQNTTHYKAIFAPAYSILLTSEGAKKWQLPQSVGLCLVEGKIMALSLAVGNDDEFPQGWITDWVKTYGVPKLVTWVAMGNTWCWRQVVWPQHGLAASVDVAALASHPGAALVNSVTLFPYAEEEDYLSTWPFNSFNRQPPTSVNEDEECPSEENPFDFESMLALPTEKP